MRQGEQADAEDAALQRVRARSINFAASRAMIPSATRMKLAARLSRIGESATMKVTRRAAELKAQGIDVVSFGAGEPDFGSPGGGGRSGAPGTRRRLHEIYGGDRTRGSAPRAARALPPRVGRALERAAARPRSRSAPRPPCSSWRSRWSTTATRSIIPTPCWVSFPDQVQLCGGRAGVRRDRAPTTASASAPRGVLDAITDRRPGPSSSTRRATRPAA